jgi:hypothetical protein
MKAFNIHPYIRLFFLFGTISSIILFHQTWILGLLYVLFILPLIFLTAIFRNHIRLLIFGILPISLTFILIYVLILKGTNGGWDFILVKIFKILDITSVFQIALTIKSDALFSTFRKIGIKGESLITVIGAFTVWADIKRRSEQIITARFARGFIGKRSYINIAKQFPYIMVPLIIGILRTSIERSQTWTQWDIVDLINNRKLKSEEFPVITNLGITLVTTLCLIIGIIYN